MSKYNWNLEQLILQRKIYKDKLNALVDAHYKSRTKKLYEELYKLYDDLIINYDIRCITNRLDIETDCTNPTTTDLVYLKENVFDQISQSKIDLATGCINIGKEYSLNFQEPSFTNLTINDDELIERTRILFEQLPVKYFLDKFDYFANPSKHLLHIRYFQKLLTDDSGLVFIDPKNHIPYGLVSRCNTVQDIITTGHEIFHMVIREQEQPFFAYSSKTVFGEVEGCFANLLFSDVLANKDFNNDEIFILNIKELIGILDIAKTTFVVENGFRLMTDGKIDFDRLSPILKSKNISTKVTKNNFTYFIDENYFEDDLNHNISYLVALDLYELYKKDPEKALHHLLTIPSLNGHHIKKDLDKIDVTFFKDNYSNLSKQCKKLLKENTTSKKK